MTALKPQQQWGGNGLPVSLRVTVDDATIGPCGPEGADHIHCHG